MTFSSPIGRKRKRVLQSLPIGGVRGRKSYGRVDYTYDNVGVGFLNSSQFTWSEGHPFGYKNPKDGRLYDFGGPFLTGKVQVHTPARFTRKFKLSGSNPGGSIIYEGTLGPSAGLLTSYDQPLPASNTWDSFRTLRVFEDLSSKIQLEARGTTAIAQCSPTQQAADVFVALREISRDGLPHIPGVSQDKLSRALDDFHRKKKAGLIKGTAEEYLNIIFGWSPLLADVGKIYRSIRDFEKNMQQFKRDAGRVVRRKYHFPNSQEHVVLQDGPTTQAWPSGILTDSRLYASGEVVNRHFYHDKRIERNQWFSGAFTYYLHEGDALIDKMLALSQEADYLFGAGLTLENLWNSSPWTWFVDWFANAGDVISNFSDMISHGLVLRYGYVMESTVSKHHIDYSPTKSRQGVVSLRDADYTVYAKQRLAATPFGFGLNVAGLSAQQKLIMAALAITRA